MSLGYKSYLFIYFLHIKQVSLDSQRIMRATLESQQGDMQWTNVSFLWAQVKTGEAT